MSIRVLQVLAGLFALAAVLLVLAGWRLASSVSQQEPVRTSINETAREGEASANAIRYPALVAVNEMPTGHLIREQDLRLVEFPFSVARGVTEQDVLIDKVLTRPVKMGNVIRRNDIESLPGVGSEVDVGMRAVAIAIDEVVGVGSHVKPGDHVDVHFVSNTGISSQGGVGRTLFSNLRVLSVGSDYLKPEGQDEATTRSARSVVLEVPKPFAPLLTLAETSGVLRLALIGQDELMEETYLATLGEDGAEGSTGLHQTDLASDISVFNLAELTTGNETGQQKNNNLSSESTETDHVVIQFVGREVSRVSVAE